MIDLNAEHYYAVLEKLLAAVTGDTELFETIVDAPFSNPKQTTLFSLGVVVLLLVDKKTGTIDRIALSNTEPAQGAVNMSAKPFKAIKIPVGFKDNLIARVIESGQPAGTDDWQYLFIPDLTPEEAHFNQAGAGIGCSYVYPLKARDGGAMIFSYYEPPAKIGESHHDFMRTYSGLVSARLSAPSTS